MWYDRSRSYVLGSEYAFRSFQKQDYTVRKGSYERLINHYYGKNSLFKRTLPHAGNYGLLELNEATKDLEIPLHHLLDEMGGDSDGNAQDFVESYNKLLESFDSLNNNSFINRKNWLTSLTDTYRNELHRAGFVILEDGTLTEKTDEEQAVLDEESFNELFQGENCYGNLLLDCTVKIGYEALSTLSRSPKLYSPSGSFIYTINTGTLYNDVI